MTEDATAILAWCQANLSKHTRLIAGRECPTINLWWHGTARALGYDADCREATARTLAAFAELRSAGQLASYDEGPATFGHTTLCYTGEDAEHRAACKTMYRPIR